MADNYVYVVTRVIQRALPCLSEVKSPIFRNFKFVRVCSLVGRYFYSLHIVNKFEKLFYFNIKDNNNFPCLHTIRLSYNT